VDKHHVGVTAVEESMQPPAIISKTYDATAVVKWVIYPGCAIQRGSKEKILVKEN